MNSNQQDSIWKDSHVICYSAGLAREMGHVIQKQQVQVVQNEPETQSEEVRGQHLSTWLDLMSLT